MAAPTRAFALIGGFDAAATSDTTAAFSSAGYTHVAVWVKHEGAAATITPSDNKGSTAWSKLTYRSNVNGDLNGQWMWAPIGTPGTGHTVTVSFSVDTPAPGTPSARPYVRVGVMLMNSSTGVLALVAGSDVTDQGSSTTPDAGSITTAEAALLLMAVGEYTNASYTPSAGWTEDWDPNGTNSIWSFGASRSETAAGTFDPTCTQSASAAWVCGAAAFVEVTGGGTPTVTGTSSATPRHGDTLTIAGTSFGASGGSVAIGGVAQTVISWSATSIVVKVDRGTNKYGVAVNVVVTDSGAVDSNAFALTSLQPPVGWAYTDQSTQAGSGLLPFSPALASGDQGAVQTARGLFSLASDGTYSVSGAGYVSVQYEGWSTGSGWGARNSVTVFAQSATNTGDGTKGAPAALGSWLRLARRGSYGGAFALLRPSPGSGWKGTVDSAQVWSDWVFQNPTAAGVTTTINARSGVRADVAAAKGVALVTAGRAGARAAATGTKAATAAVAGRAGARGDVLAAKAVAATTAARAGARASVTAVAAIGRSTSTEARAGVRADTAGTKAASAATAGRVGARADLAATKAAAHATSGRAGARASVTAVAAVGIATSTQARAGVRADVAGTKAAQGATASRAGARADLAAAKAVALATSARVGARASVAGVPVSGITTSTASRAGARASVVAVRGASTATSSAAGVRGAVAALKATQAVTAARAGVMGANAARKAANTSTAARVGVRAGNGGSQLLPFLDGRFYKLPAHDGYYTLPPRSAYLDIQ